SSPILLFGNLIRSFIIVFMIMMLIVSLVFQELYIYVVTFVSLTISVLYVLLVNYITVTISNTEIHITKIGGREYVWQLSEYVFASHVTNHSVNGIPVGTDRIIRAQDANGEYKLSLPNMSKKSYDAIFSLLRKNEMGNQQFISEDGNEVQPIILSQGREEYHLPRDKMLKEHQGFIKFYCIIAIVGSVLIGSFLFYQIYSNSRADMLTLQTIFLIFICSGLIFLIPVFFIFSAYNKKKTIPEKIIWNKNGIYINDKEYQWIDIQSITMTPPAYTQTKHGNMRVIIIETARGKEKIYLGVCAPVGRWKAFFGEYPKFCIDIENITKQHNIQFIFDL
ncbi:MAG: hypothetical protein ACK5LC_00915, partial [Coprobacillaceae bacterium]